MLPPLDENGDLAAGIHQATWAEITRRFGTATETRVHALARLLHLHELAVRTGKLKRFCVFGSFVTSAPDPHDIDVALLMAADFRVEESPRECRTLFLHAEAQARYGASIFWLREGMLSDELMREFFDTWQIKRDGAKRGIVEVQP
ncbi:MAG: hypothetical protein A3I02_06170 [Betaproteobacteria bacterium RIFCSPLOWO2_02_FULL_67_26]|nr:MAG: hypothetical protein A3I02_06170 [Betaproteobacteria bacterium RIFCSPLOWO2_02_FULL_67_26]